MDATSDKNEERRDDGAPRKLGAVELSMRKLTDRIIELELIEAIAKETAAKVRKKEQEVAEEIRRLDQLQYERWQSRSDFCEEIWKFAADHDLCAIFNQFLDTPTRIPRVRVAFDKNRHPDVVEARTELEKLKSQLNSKIAERRRLEEKIVQAKIQLQIAKSYCETDEEINRLKNDVDNCEEQYFELESKIATMELNFVDWHQLPANIGTKDTKRRNFVTASELIARDEINDTIKRSRFSVKKESAISRKLADSRRSRRRDY